MKSYAIMLSYSPPKGVSSSSVSLLFFQLSQLLIRHICTRIWLIVGTLFKLVTMSFPQSKMLLSQSIVAKSLSSSSAFFFSIHAILSSRTPMSRSCLSRVSTTTFSL